MPPHAGPDWKHFIYHATRSRRGLWRICGAILGLGAVIGGVASHFHRAPPEKVTARILARAGVGIEENEEELEKRPNQTEEIGAPARSLLPAIEAEMARGDVSFADVFNGIPQLAIYLTPAELPRLHEMLARRFPQENAALAIDFVAAWNLDDHAAYQRLTAAADSPHPPHRANYALGRVEMKRKDYHAAATRFQREGRNPAEVESRWRALHALLKARDYPALETLRRDDAYRKLFNRHIELEIATARHDWPVILRLSPIVQFTSYEPAAVAIAAVVGLAWGFFLFHLGEWNRFLRWPTLLALGGLVCGVISTIPTLYAVTWQEGMLQVAAGEEPWRILLYYTAGVGVREEVCKLLLFAPLIPLLLWRDDDLDALIVASFVGLGFAIEEDAGYFMASEATNAAGRYLSANFLHVALTGLSGLALYRMCRWGIRGLNEFLWVFPLAIVIHGAFDAVQDIPGINQGGIASTLVFIGACYLYFDHAHALQNGARLPVSVTGAFLLGLSVVCATLVAYETYNLGPKPALAGVGAELLGSAILVFVFLRVFREPLSD